MQSMVHSFFKRLWIGTAALIMLAAVCTSVFRALTPFASQYKTDVEHHLSTLLGQPVTIQSMETGWYWFQPVLKLQQVTVNDGSTQALHLDKLLVGINLFKSLWEWQVQPGVLVIDDLHLVIREEDGKHWRIDGITSNTMDSADLTPERTQHVLVWLAEQERLVIRHVSARVHLQDGTLIPISGLNVSIHNRGGQYKIKGEARLDQTNGTRFELLGDVYFDPYHLDKTAGQLYFAAQNLSLNQWESLVPKSAPLMQGGKGDVAIWLDLTQGLISSVQADLKLSNFSWALPHHKQSQLVQSLLANISWKQGENGWKLEADNIKLRIGGLDWPENKLLLAFDNAQQSYQAFVQSIHIQSLLAQPIDWPQSLQSILAVRPEGTLTGTQVLIKDQQLNSVLSRFDHLGWKAHKSIPEVHNVSGVLNWQAQEGHIELDSEQTSIKAKGYPEQKIDLLNAAIEWKELNDGTRISIDRFILKQKDLTVSVEGALDQVTADSLGHIRIDANYAGDNAHKLMAFLPKKYLKPKLYAWLKNDIKRINKATASVHVNGNAKDFPFDSGTGEFTVTAHAAGADLLITPKWPLITDIEGYIKVNKRDLNVDLVHGDIQGVPLEQMNLRIDDIGKDKETLLIHTAITGFGQKMLNFVMASPLQKKLSTLKMLALKGMVGINLRLEVPLYPENDDVIVRGDLNFQHDTATFKHEMAQIKLKDMTGSLSFDEKGIKDSAMMANLFGSPVHIKMQSVAAPLNYTAVQVNGLCTVESLQEQLKLPALANLQGMFYVNASLKLTEDPNDFDSMEIDSNLEGLAIDAPEPFAKVADAKIPLHVKLEFNAEKGTHVEAKYADKAQSDFWLGDNKGNVILKSGQATLPHLTLFKQNLDGITVKAKSLPDNDWSLRVEQKNIAGDLVYQPSTNSINGHLSRVYLGDLQLKGNNSHAHPLDIPNLNLRIDNLKVGKKDIGNMTIRTHSTKESLNIEYCRIESPVYQFMMTGVWTQKDKFNKTKVEAKAHLNDLAKSLKRWDITPAVDAGKGDIEFEGSWNNTLLDFSLASVDGTLGLKLKKGIITHLSPETEEKLGLGKLLSILSLQTIPRRLQLDFSDLSHEGYSFDVFKGNFDIQKGIMRTDNSYVDGPVAYAGMKGELDLVRHLYDLDLKISPHITASLPVVATIAGGPIAELAAWVANKIINQGMQKIIAYTYKISGPWNEPVVQQVSMVKQISNKINGPDEFVNELEYQN